ncbi:MAG TPA: hypothetical protein LFW21_06285 [Rickettsia endosymbiont of Pyrocoelia pectoralis]|nr:hypothetical protein [Rickettsia endosymbiont of Pyrocoelia pectoralis]
MPNMDIGEKEEYLNSVRNIVKGEWSSSWREEVSDIWQLIAKYECMENFKYLLRKHEFSIDQYGEKKALEAFEILLLFFSVGQVFNLSWQTVRDVQYYSSLKDNEYDADNIVSIIINNIHKKVSKALEEKWIIKNSRRDFCLPQTIISSTFFNTFLELGNEYFGLVMPLE